MADASQNNPKKEITYALVGIVAFLGIVLLIGISAFLRPAGDHVVPEAAVEETTTEDVATNAEATATDTSSDTQTDAAEATTDDTVTSTAGTEEATIETDSSASTGADGSAVQTEPDTSENGQERAEEVIKENPVDVPAEPAQ